MIFLAIQMLWNDTAKLLAMVMAVSLAAFLTQNQASFLVAFLGMAGSQIRDVREANFWVMDSDTESFDQAKPLKDTAIGVIRGFEGIEWAVPFTKLDVAARTNTGKLSTVSVIGVNEESRIGEPLMTEGSAEAIYLRDSCVIDPGGFYLLFSESKLRSGMMIRIYDEWLTVRGISAASAPFTGFPIIHVSQTTAMRLSKAEQRTTTFITARTREGFDARAIASGIEEKTGLKAMTRDEFMAASSKFYSDQGVPALFYITITIGLIVGIAFTGQTFLMFVKENARSFTVMKVLGFTRSQIMMILGAQATSVVFLGLAFGTAAAVGASALATQIPFLRGVYIPWQVSVACCLTIGAVTILSTGLSMRNVLRLQPADVFR
jgi:putative ABC transport system permease protein